MKEIDGTTYYAMYDVDDTFEEEIWTDNNTSVPVPPVIAFDVKHYINIGAGFPVKY